MRERLPDDRSGKTRHFTILYREEKKTPEGKPTSEVVLHEMKGYITANTYPDGRLGEIFVRVGKAGATEAWLDAWALSSSIALQHGAGVDELFGKFVGMRFEPSGAVKWMDGIDRCSSPPDLISRYLIKNYSNKTE